MEQIIAKIDGMMCGMCESHMNDMVRNNFKVKNCLLYTSPSPRD